MWNEIKNGICSNADPIVGGIIDVCPTSKTWFVIFNHQDIPCIEGVLSRELAIEAHAETIFNFLGESPKI